MADKKAAIFLLLMMGIVMWAQEPLSYEVSVDAMLVPLFVVDSKGNPVYDLAREELELYVNGTPMEITWFKRFEFEYDKVTNREVAVKKEPVLKPPDRIIFIIIDGVFNSSPGLRRSKKIAVDIIKEGGEGDRFVIVQNTPSGGIKHIAGPGGTREFLIKKVKKIIPMNAVWKRGLFSGGGIYGRRSGSDLKTTFRGQLEVMEYQKSVKRLGLVLARFKYVLKTITRPKIVFLISEGISKGAFEENSGINSGPEHSIYSPVFLKIRLFDYLKKIVNAVNNGGSVLYAINPQNILKSVDERASGEISLRYLAGESGGKYFAGSDTRKIIKQVRKTTAAYYELAFNIPSQLGENLKLKIICKRKGTRVHTLSRSERNRPYRKMEALQKKVFAYNVVTGGSWSRMLGTVEKANFKKMKKDKNKFVIEVELPEEMKNRELDVFIIDTHPAGEAVSMHFKTAKATGTLRLNIKPAKIKNQSFVIIDPIETRCLFGELKK